MMPPIILTLLQGLLLLLLYVFVARAVRAILRDVSATPRAAGVAPAPDARAAAPRRRSAPAAEQ